jgi:hypothetical protein
MWQCAIQRPELPASISRSTVALNVGPYPGGDQGRVGGSAESSIAGGVTPASASGTEPRMSICRICGEVCRRCEHGSEQLLAAVAG